MPASQESTKIEIPFNASKGISSTLFQNKWPYFGKNILVAARRWYSWLPDACVPFRSATQKENGGVRSRSPKNEKSNMTAILC